MPRISIVIACPDDHRALEDTLVSVLERRPDDCEIIVAHDGGYDDPYELAGEVRFLTVDRPTSWAAMCNMALRRCHSQVVHLLARGVLARDGWIDAALPLFDDPSVAMVAPRMVSVNDEKRIVAVGLSATSGGRRRVATRVPLTEQERRRIVGPIGAAAFYRLEPLLALGGLPECLGDRWADVDLAHSLRAIGLTADVAIESVVACDGAVERRASGAFRDGFRAERFYRRHRTDQPTMLSAVAHGAVVFAEAASTPLRPSNVLRLFGRLAGRFGQSFVTDYRSQIAELSRRFASSDEPVSLPMRTATDESSRPLRRAA